MTTQIYDTLLNAKKSRLKKFVVLIDPDKMRLNTIQETIHLAAQYDVDYFFIGGSLVVNNMLNKVLMEIKNQSDIPTILFPGNSFQLSNKADALLYLSLISGRNAELLIGNHVISAPFLRTSNLEVISTGYMLIDGGITTSVQYMSNTTPIPSAKKDIAVCTALAGQYLGLKQIYMDAGSGATHPVPCDMITSVSEALEVPLVVGGGISSAQKVYDNYAAGADIIVVGNAIESNPQLIREMSVVKEEFNTKIQQ